MAERRAVAFLFTDIEGSTRLLRGLGEEAYGAVLAEHARVLVEAISAGGGTVVDMQGDACFAAFPSAVGAVHAAISAQRALAAAIWPGGSRLRVRMGVHLGFPMAASGRYLGLDVHLAARIGAVAQGEQVLVSQAVHTAISPSSAPPGFSFQEIGPVWLKDFDEPQVLWQVVASGLRADFEKSPHAEATDLPFAGRETELADAAAAAIVRSARRQERRRNLAVLTVLAVIIAVALGYQSTRPPTQSVVGDSVAELDIRSGRVVRDVALNSQPTALAANGSAVYALSGGTQGTVTRIDQATGDTNTYAATGSTDIVYGFGRVWVADGLTRAITVLDPKSLAKLSSIPILQHLGVLGVPDAHLAIGSNRVWVDNGGDAGVTTLDPAHLESRTTAPIRGIPTGAIVSGGGDIWTGSGTYYFGSGTVAQVDPKTGATMATFAVGEVDGLAYGLGYAWVTDSATGMLEKLRPAPRGAHGATGTVVKQFRLGAGIGGITVGSGGSGWPTPVLAKYSGSLQAPARCCRPSRCQTAPRSWWSMMDTCGSRYCRRLPPWGLSE